MLLLQLNLQSLEVTATASATILVEASGAGWIRPRLGRPVWPRLYTSIYDDVKAARAEYERFITSMRGH